MAFHIEYSVAPPIGYLNLDFDTPDAQILNMVHSLGGDTDQLILLRADGDQLDWIRSRFDNLPITRGPVCEWRGGMAKFICLNFPDQ